MKAKRIIACTLIASLTFGNLLGMKKKTGAAQIIEKEIERILKHKYFIRVYSKTFPVIKEVLEQFEAYTTEKEFGQKALTEKPAIQKTETSTLWDITESIRTFIGKPSQKDWALFTRLIELMLGVISKKIDPYRIKTDLLFMLIKVADLLRNKQIMQNCVPALMRKITGGLLHDEPVRTFPDEYDTSSITLLRKKDLFLSASEEDEDISLWNINETKRIRTFEDQGLVGAGSILLTRHPNLFISYSLSSDYIRLWAVSQTKPFKKFPKGRDNKFKVILLPGTDLFLSCSMYGIKLWNINQTKSVRTFTEHSVETFNIVLLPNTELFLSYSGSGTIKLWNIKKIKPIRTFKGHAKDLDGIIPLRETGLFLSYSQNGIIKLWSINKIEPIRTFKAFKKDHTNLWPVSEVVLLQGTSWFLSLVSGGMIILWNINHTKPYRIWREHTRTVHSIIPDIKGFFLSSSEDGTIKLWNINRKRSIRTFGAHGNCKVALIGINKFISYSADTPTKLWNMNYNIPRMIFPYRMTLITPLSNNKQFLSNSGGPSTEIMLWDINPFANLTFEQVELCFSIFTSKDPVRIKKGSYENKILESLPNFIKKEAVKKVNQ